MHSVICWLNPAHAIDSEQYLTDALLQQPICIFSSTLPLAGRAYLIGGFVSSSSSSSSVNFSFKLLFLQQGSYWLGTFKFMDILRTFNLFLWTFSHHVEFRRYTCEQENRDDSSLNDHSMALAFEYSDGNTASSNEGTNWRVWSVD